MEEQLILNEIPIQARFVAIVSSDFMNKLGDLLHSRFPERIIATIQAALKILRPVIYVQTGNLLGGSLLEILNGLLSDISTEMIGKAVILYQNSDSVIIGYEICKGEVQELGIPIYFCEVNDPVFSTRTLVSSGVDGNGQDDLHETSN